MIKKNSRDFRINRRLKNKETILKYKKFKILKKIVKSLELIESSKIILWKIEKNELLREVIKILNQMKE